MDEKKDIILKNFSEFVKNTQEQLRIVGVPEPLIVYYTINLPDFKKLLPEDVVKFYKEVKVAVVLYLDGLGFSEREIERRLGASSLFGVRQILGEYRPKPKVVSPHEVEKGTKEVIKA